MFKNKDLEIFKTDEGYGIVVYNTQMANKINRALDMHYDCKIRDGEHPVFRIRTHEMALVLTQMTKGMARDISSSFGGVKWKIIKNFGYGGKVGL